MEKVDLLVHIQKIQLELDQTKDKFLDDDLCQQKLREKDEIISRFQEDLMAKDFECKNWMRKIEQVNDLTEDLEEKIQKLENDFQYEKSQKEHFQALFQEVSARRPSKEMNFEIEGLKNELLQKDKEMQEYKDGLEFKKSDIIKGILLLIFFFFFFFIIFFLLFFFGF